MRAKCRRLALFPNDAWSVFSQALSAAQAAPRLTGALQARATSLLNQLTVTPRQGPRPLKRRTRCNIAYEKNRIYTYYHIIGTPAGSLFAFVHPGQCQRAHPSSTAALLQHSTRMREHAHTGRGEARPGAARKPKPSAQPPCRPVPPAPVSAPRGPRAAPLTSSRTNTTHAHHSPASCRRGRFGKGAAAA